MVWCGSDGVCVCAGGGGGGVCGVCVCVGGGDSKQTYKHMVQCQPVRPLCNAAAVQTRSAPDVSGSRTAPAIEGAPWCVVSSKIA